MSARNRCLCQSRSWIWLTAALIQFKRGCLAVGRGTRETLTTVSWLPWLLIKLAWYITLWPIWVLCRWVWEHVLFPPEETSSPMHLPLSKAQPETPVAPTSEPASAWNSARDFTRFAMLQTRRMGLRIRQAFAENTAWTFATVTGSLGVLLMVILQAIYSFQSLTASEPVAKQHEEPAKVRIDPGMPQSRQPHELAMSDRQTFSTQARFSPPAETQPVNFPAEPPRKFELEPWIDPLDMVPPLEAEPVEIARSPQPARDPFAQYPSAGDHPSDIPADFDPNAKARTPVEDDFPPVEDFPPTLPSQVPSPAIPDPLDQWPSQDPVLSNEPPADAVPYPTPEPEFPPKDPFPDPLDNWPSRDPLPANESPADSVPFPTPEPEFPPKDDPPDPLDNWPRETEPDPPRFPEPLPEREEPTNSEPNPFPDPLDNLLPLESPREWNAPAARTPEPTEIEIGIQRLPREQSDNFWVYSAQVISLTALTDAWDRSRRLSEPVPIRSYQERLSAVERDQLERDLARPTIDSHNEPAAGQSVNDVRVGIEKYLPRSSAANVPLRYEIQVENRGPEMIDSVDIDEAVPPSHRVVDVNPAGHFENDLLRWRLRELRPGEKRRLTVDVIPTESGNIETTTSVRPSVRVDSATMVEKNSAKIQLTVNAPERVRVGEPCPLTFRVTNLGDEDAKNLVLREQLPAGLKHRIGRDVELVIDRLPAGSTREAKLTPIAERTGRLENLVEVSTGDQILETATTRTEVYEPPLRLRRSGFRTVSDKESVRFTNHVQNLSDETQRDVKIVEEVPRGFHVVEVKDGGIYDRDRGTITWRLTRLPAGETAKLDVHLRAMGDGELRSRVEGSTSDGEAVPIKARVQVRKVSARRLTNPERKPTQRIASAGNFGCCCRCRCQSCCCH